MKKIIKKSLVEKEGDIIWKSNYFDHERCTKIHFFDYQTENNLYFFGSVTTNG